MKFGANIQKTLERSLHVRFHVGLLFNQLFVFQTGHRK